MKTSTVVPDPVSPAAARAPTRRGGLASLALSMLVAALGTSIANVALPTLAAAFGAGFEAVQWVVLAYLLAVTTLIVSVGRLGDLTGRRRLLLGGILLFTAASLLGGLAPSLWLLIAARAAQGIGAAVLMALTMAFVGDTVPKAKVGAAMGLLGTTSAIGTALGPSLGGVLIAGLGWRSIFFVQAPLGVLSYALVRRSLPADARRAAAARTPFDTLGTVLLAATLAAYALAMTIGRGHFGALALGLLLAAVVLGGLFVLAEAKADAPLLRPSSLRDAVLGPGLAMSLLVATVVMATLVVGPFHLARGLGLDAAAVGLVMSVGPLVAAATGLPAGRLVDRLGAQSMTFAGLAAMAVGSSLLALLPAELGVAGYIGPVATLTAGYAVFQAANNTAVMQRAHADQRGVVGGLLNLSRNLGLVTGASLLGAVFAAGSGTAEVTTAPPAAVAAGMRTTFALAALLLGGAIAVAVGSRAASRTVRSQVCT